MSNDITNGSSYWFMSYNTRNVLDLTGGDPTGGTPVIGYWAHLGPNQQNNQKWSVTLKTTDSGVNWFKLTNANSKTVLELKNGSSSDKTPVICNALRSTNDDSQLWCFVPANKDAGTSTAQTQAYKIKNKASGTFIDIDGDGGNLTPVVGLADAGGAFDHRWVAFPAYEKPATS